MFVAQANQREEEYKNQIKTLTSRLKEVPGPHVPLSVFYCILCFYVTNTVYVLLRPHSGRRRTASKLKCWKPSWKRYDLDVCVKLWAVSLSYAFQLCLSYRNSCIRHPLHICTYWFYSLNKYTNYVGIVQVYKPWVIKIKC